MALVSSSNWTRRREFRDHSLRHRQGVNKMNVGRLDLEQLITWPQERFSPLAALNPR